ncbi:MAG: tetratricopeptide repeat protein [Deltaproteobacteria bacterium]
MRVAFRNHISSGLLLGGIMVLGTLAFQQTALAQSQAGSTTGQQPAAQTTAQAEAPKQPPFTEKEVVQLVKKNKKHLQEILPELTARGVAFDMTPQIQQELLKAGATPDFVANVQNLGPTARAQVAAAAGKGSRPPEEVQAFQAVQNELDMDRKIQEANDFVTKYPDSPLLTYVYFLAQSASLQKGDLQGVLSYGEKSLAANPDNLNALMLMAKFLPQPQALKDEVNPEKKLAEAEQDGEKALVLVGKLEKMPDESDEAFTKRKGNYLEAIHSGLALVHLQRGIGGLAGVDQAELAKAEEEYKAALANAANPDPQDYFRLGEVLARQNKKDEAIQAFTKAGDLSTDSPQLKALADQQIAKLKGKS